MRLSSNKQNKWLYFFQSCIMCPEFSSWWLSAAWTWDAELESLCDLWCDCIYFKYFYALSCRLVWGISYRWEIRFQWHFLSPAYLCSPLLFPQMKGFCRVLCFLFKYLCLFWPWQWQKTHTLFGTQMHWAAHTHLEAQSQGWKGRDSAFLRNTPMKTLIKWEMKPRWWGCLLKTLQ